MKQIGNNTGWMKPQDDDNWMSDHEDLIDRAERLRDEMLDRQMEDRKAAKDNKP